MKTLFRIFMASLLFATAALAQAQPSAESADQLARESKFAEAAEAYEAVIAGGQESAGLYYNLGYCYFKQGMLGKAILNMERAKRLDPSDKDVAENLKMAYALTDKMEVIEPLAIEQWWAGLKTSLSSDGWAVLFIVLFFLAVCGLACFFFVDSVALRKVGFFSSLFLVVLASFSLAFSLQIRANALDSDEAIIMASSVNLNTSPDKNGSPMAVLHEGTHVTILEELGDWVEVRLIDGNVGWLLKSDIENI